MIEEGNAEGTGEGNSKRRSQEGSVVPRACIDQYFEYQPHQEQLN